MVSCNHLPTPPNWEGKVYRFSADKPEIYRKINGQIIDTKPVPSDELKKWSAMSDEDLKALFYIITQCQAWPQDVKYYQEKFKACGLWTNENIDSVKNCLENTGVK